MRKTFVLTSIIWLSLYSCNDILNTKKKIVGNYYLVEGDTRQDLSVCYYVDGVNVRRVPGQVVRYGYSDSFLVAERVNYLNEHSYYVINMLRDGDTARHKETFLTGPISEEEYKRNWESELNINLRSIK